MADMKKRHEDLVYKKPTSNNPAILGTLEGPCADIINPTRNGRKYGDQLWRNVFNNEIVKEYFECGGVFGELGHPADRSETDMEKIAICMPEPPTTGKDGLLIGRWDILDTPNGRILKTLVDYGYKIGISSRGTGDVYTGDDGEEYVDEDTYDFQAFDAVILPAVKAARLSSVNESLHSGKTFKQALAESLNKANPDEKKIMEATLKDLNIELVEEQETLADESIWKAFAEANPNYNKEFDFKKYGKYFGKDGKLIPEYQEEFFREWKENLLECNSESCADTKATEVESTQTDSKITDEAEDNGLEEMIKNLQEAVKRNSELEAQVLDLQNKVAVSDTEVNKLNEELSRYKTSTARLSTIAKNSKDLSEKVSSLEEQLRAKDEIIKSKNERISKLAESKKNELSKTYSLNESISNKDKEIKTLSENFNTYKTQSEAKIKELTESIKDLRKTSESQYSEYSTKISKANKLIESYKSLANETVKRYIESKATMLGITSNEIRSRLNEKYTIDDIDAVCEDLQDYNLNISKLPFNINRNVRVKVTESKNDSLRINNGIDDDVDESLIRMAKNLK